MVAKEIAPILAARNKEVAFIVMLAGPGTKGSIFTQTDRAHRSG